MVMTLYFSRSTLHPPNQNFFLQNAWNELAEQEKQFDIGGGGGDLW